MKNTDKEVFARMKGGSNIIPTGNAMIESMFHILREGVPQAFHMVTKNQHAQSMQAQALLIKLEVSIKLLYLLNEQNKMQMGMLEKILQNQGVDMVDSGFLEFPKIEAMIEQIQGEWEVAQKAYEEQMRKEQEAKKEEGEVAPDSKPAESKLILPPTGKED